MGIEELKKCFNQITIFTGEYDRRIEGMNIFRLKYKEVPFLVAFDDFFPNSKPFIFAPRVNSLDEFIPHILSANQVCYLDNEGIILDEQNPVGIIREAVLKAYDTVINSVTGNSKEDFLLEFDYYWNNVQEPNSIFVSLIPDLNRIELVWLGMVGENYVVAQTKDEVKEYLARASLDSSSVRFQKVLHIPLTKSGGVSFSKKWNISYLRKLIYSNIGFRAGIDNILKEDFTIPIYVTLPLMDESRVHFGIQFERPSNKIHPLLDEANVRNFEAIVIDRMDVDYLLPRGGANRSLYLKKVCIIGCGAVGGIVANELAKAGIGNLFLIDDDRLTKDNLYRHHLGNSSGLGTFKVEGLKKRIESDLPLSNVETCNKKIEIIIRDNLVNFDEYDLIVDATGVPNSSFYSLKYFYENFPAKPLIHVWLEPLGIGGHAIASNNNKMKGCYKCIYSQVEEYGIYNKASFAAPGQNFSKSMFGCAGRFTPFSSRDATRTAILAVDLAEAILLGIEKDNPLLSWKGDSTRFLENEFKLSDRYTKMSMERLFENRYEYKKEKCLICSKKEI